MFRAIAPIGTIAKGGIMLALNAPALAVRATVLSISLLVLLALSPSAALAQSSSSEMFAGSGNTSATPPTEGPVSADFLANTNNPTGNTATTIASPTPDVTIRVLNQQFANSTNFTTRGLMIGGTFAGDPHLTTMNFFGGAQSNHFTSLPSVTAGTGINVGINHAFLLEARTGGLNAAGAPLTGRIYFADVELTFSRPISNTVVHLAGFGGTISGKEFSVELDLVPANSTGVTGVSLLSGNGLLSVSGNQINNSFVYSGSGAAGNCGTSTAACGSVRITGDAVTRIYFRVYMRSRNNVSWASGGSNGSEGWFLGVSGHTSDMTPQLSGLPTTIEKGASYTGLSLTCTNNGPNLAVLAQCVPSASEGTVSNVVCDATLPASVSELSGSNQVSCTFDYTLPIALSGSSINFIGQTGAANDRIGGDVLSSPNNETTASASVLDAADLLVTKTNTPGVNGNVDQANDSVTSGSNTTYTIQVTNNGPDAAVGAVVTDTPGAGITCAPTAPVTITGDGNPGGTFTFADLSGGGITLGTLADGQTATLTYSCQVN